MEADMQEEILTELKNRFVMFPIKYNAIWQMYKKAVSAFWTVEELDLSKDMDDWNKLNENEHHFIKNILAFFAASDGIVNENLASRFINEVKAPEAKAFYGFQIAMENIHCVPYHTEILTDKGYVTIGSYEGKICNIWNGKNFRPVMIMKTDISNLYTIDLDNGMQVKCTPSHEWLVKTAADNVIRIPANELEPGMILDSFEYPQFQLEDEQIFSSPSLHGELAAQPIFKSYQPMQFNCRSQHYVPVNYGNTTKRQWIKGLFKNSIKDENLNKCWLPHNDLEFLRQVQLLFTTMNIASSINIDTDTNTNIDTKHYLCVSNFVIKAIQDGQDIPYSDMPLVSNLQVVNVTSSNELHQTYCFEEPENHTGFFNGVMTGQSETYSLLIDTYIKNGQEKNFLLNAMDTIPCIKKKAEWTMNWIKDDQDSFAMRLIAFAVVEGIFFSGAFCSIFWLKERSLMPGLCTSNEFISRDESLHTEFAVLLYSMIQNKLPQETIHAIVKEAVTIEEEFINESIPCHLIGMNSELMSQYIRFVADRLVTQLGCDKIYNASNPFAFMERISLSQKTNFFEFQTTSEYSKANVGLTNDTSNIHNFSLDADF